MSDYTKAPEEVLHLAAEIIEQYHPELEGGAIGFIMCDVTKTKNGKKILGTASKIPPKIQPFLDLDFLIVLDYAFWVHALEIQKRALLDHELCHCGYSEKDGEETAKINPHDFEEFAVILTRYGLWNLDLQEAREAMDQALQYPMPGFQLSTQPQRQPTRLVSIEPEQMETGGGHV